jgi:hypothetical protein
MTPAWPPFALGLEAAAQQGFWEALQQTVAEFERQTEVPVALKAS